MAKRKSIGRGDPTPANREPFGDVALDFRTSSAKDQDHRLARREARRKTRLRRRKLGYSLLVALFVGIAGASLALESMEKTPVSAVATPTVAPPKPPPKPATLESASGAPAAGEPANSGLSGDPDALKARIEEIAAYYGGTYGVRTYDPDTGKGVSLGTDETFFAASIGKLPALLSLYESVAAGELDLDDEISIYSSDVQSYGTGVLHNRAVGSTLTLRESAYYLMNQSDNTAWAMLTRYLGIDEIQADLRNIGARDTNYWIPNTTTAGDVSLMLQKIADPSFTSPELSEEMLASMTDTDFEDRIPAGLPPDVRVAHKIGSYDGSFSDAGIVLYKGPGGKDRRYVIVVLTAGIGEGTARAAIQEISAAAYETFATTRR
ncbi:MAG: serine hydrolase [Rubrobacteraceae bacterium]